jgi:antitoxin component YwqK of YwqJK toxin-antitoxin module
MLKIFCFVFAVFLLVGCRQTQDAPEAFARPRAVFVRDTPGVLERQNGLLLHHGRPFDGYFLELFPNGDTASVGGFVLGKAEGVSKSWYTGGRLREIRFYRAGKKTGRHLGWWDNGAPKFEFNFQNDLHEGPARTWYAEGSPDSDFFYQNGYETGAQRAWYPDGTLRLNYVVREGRKYGLTGVKNCETVWDSTVQKFVEKRNEQ